MANVPQLFGLENFGLTPTDLEKLGETPVVLRAYIRHPDEKRLFRLEPAQRAERIRNWYARKTNDVVAMWPVAAVRVLRSKSRSYGVSGTVSASDVSALMKMSQLRDIWIERVGNRKRRKMPASSRQLRWYAVRAIFAIQVEGRSSGMQRYEDRIVAVMAHDADDAVSRLRPEFRAYGAP